MLNYFEDKMIELKNNDIKIFDPVSIEDCTPLRDSILNVSNKKNIKIKIETEKELHLSLCLLLYKLSIDKCNYDCSFEDKNNVLRKSFFNMGFLSEYKTMKL